MKSDKSNYAAQSPLGNKSPYAQAYNAGLLFAISREEYRATIEHTQHLTSATGYDQWNCYEISWLDTSGKPLVGCATFELPASSPFIVESKSLKLYLGSLNQHRFASHNEAVLTIENDLSSCLNTPVNVQFSAVSAYLAQPPADAVLLDTLAINCSEYQRNPALLSCNKEQRTAESLVSHVLRSNCPVTSQPDWATLTIEYSGNTLCREGLLAYIVSYRQHSGFHEQCVEQIYCDIMQYCKPEKLLVSAQYTRRGGIDINPVRSNYQPTIKLPRVNRQ